jgi:hypothetical protein
MRSKHTPTANNSVEFIIAYPALVLMRFLLLAIEPVYADNHGFLRFERTGLAMSG